MTFGSGCTASAVLGVLHFALLAGAASAGTVSVTGPAAATPGGAVTVQVALSDDLTGVYALQGALHYDPAVLTPLPSAEGVAQGYYAGAAEPFPGETIPKDADLFRMNPSTAGTLIFGYVKNPSNPAGSPSSTVPPTALRVTFQVAPTATGSTTLQLSPYTVNGRDLPPVLLGAIDGTPVEALVGTPLTLSLALRGDVDGDGAVTMNDVLLALQAAGGLPAADGVTLRVDNADVWPSGAPDGHLTQEDALRIARFLNGLETDLN